MPATAKRVVASLPSGVRTVLIALAGAVAAVVAIILVWGGISDPRREAPPALNLVEACPWTNDRTPAPAPDRPIRPEIGLSPAEGSAQHVRNIDADREPEVIRNIRLETSRPLRDLKPDQLEIYADPLIRTGDEALETVTFPEPRFIGPRFVAGQQRIHFGVCLDPRGLPAGRYTGLVNISGPPGIAGTTVAITANAKDAKSFWRGAIVALLAALVTLLFRGAADKRLELRAGPTEAQPNPPWPKWRKGLGAAMGDGQFLFTSIIALATAFGALYAAYSNDPAWGASGLTEIFSLVVTAFAAVGGQSLLASVRQGSGTRTT